MHFEIGVIVEPDESLTDLLAPFDENLEVEPYIVATKQDIIEGAKRRADDISRKLKEGKDKPEELEDWEKALLNAKTDEDYYNAAYEEYYEYDEEGNQIARYNPDSRWDWYVIGGRWENSLLRKDGVLVDYAKIKDINFTDNDAIYYQVLDWWRRYVVNSDTDHDKELKSKHTAESLARLRCKFHTGGVLAGGEWHDMDEFSEEDWINGYYDRFIKNANPEAEFVIVDCHI